MCRLSNGEEKWTKYSPMWLNFIICCRIKSLGNVTREPHKQIISTCEKQWKKFVGPEALPDTTFIMFTIFYNTCALFHRKSQIFLALDTVFVNSSRRKEHWAFTMCSEISRLRVAIQCHTLFSFHSVHEFFSSYSCQTIWCDLNEQYSSFMYIEK